MANYIEKQLAVWKSAQEAYVSAREAYRSSWAKAYLSSGEKTGDGRKCAADAATSELRLSRDMAEIAAAAEWQLLLATRGNIEGARQPGNNFGEGA